MACLYYENISFLPILCLRGPELPEWANWGSILAFVMLQLFSLISTQENRSNDMRHAYIMKHPNLIRVGTTQWRPRGVSIAQMG